MTEARKISELDSWIEREFDGHGVAVRPVNAPPIPGEPFVPMEDAKEIVRRAVAGFVAATSVPARDGDKAQRGLNAKMLDVLKRIVEIDDDARKAHGKPGANLNGFGLVDLFDCVGHPFGSGEHKQQPYRSNQLEAALADARAAITNAEAAQSADSDPMTEEPKPRYNMQGRYMTRCQADEDGDCIWSGCPQERDGEPEKTGRHCPLDAEARRKAAED